MFSPTMRVRIVAKYNVLNSFLDPTSHWGLHSIIRRAAQRNRLHCVKVRVKLGSGGQQEGSGPRSHKITMSGETG
ncbi:unnamed protein product [Arctia plantaginis]|uniref:Uncharacterized protein n=1 Tax=Arctia plantaginis TaxID=874455 RepID=A0A8S1B5W5_ARCPL|nr:unnamed protein product [Arctia plantaginis]